jgi:sulfoxide reductase catalytic subunit YedY
MPIRKKPGWTMRESEATPEGIFLDRRRLMQAAAAGGIAAAAAPWLGGLLGAARPRRRPRRRPTRRPLSIPPSATTATSSTGRSPTRNTSPLQQLLRVRLAEGDRRRAQALPIRPWTVSFDGMVEKPSTIGFDDLIRKMPLEERLYRHRCVEAWSMAVPWSGFPMKALVELAKPLGARNTSDETFKNPRWRRASGSSGIPGPISRA